MGSMFDKFTIYADNDECMWTNTSKDIEKRECDNDDAMMQEYVEWCRTHVGDTHSIFFPGK